jgi:hypothetical protein
MSVEYFYLLMSQEDLFHNEVIEEIFRERSSSYLLQGKPNDFWILISPKFIEKKEIQEQIKQTNFYKQRAKLIENEENKCEFYAAIVSLDKEFITWLSLRLGYFEKLKTKEKEITSLKIFAENQVQNNVEQKKQEYTSNGIIGLIFSSTETDHIIFDYNPIYLHSQFSIEKYKILLDVFVENKFQ